MLRFDVLFALLTVLGGPTAAPDERPEGHRRMLALLKQLAEDGDTTNIYLGEAAARDARAKFASMPDNAPAIERWQGLRFVAFHEMRLGNTARAIELLSAARQLLPDVASQTTEKEALQSLFDLGTAYMRLGERQNCVARHTSRSCILPITGDGVHVDQEASRRAIEIFEGLIAEKPRDVSSRWLLNIAYMTVGGWPDDLPEKLLAPPDAFGSAEEFPRLVDVAPELGLDTNNLCGGAITDDFDGDGDYDVLTSTWELDGQMLYFAGDGAGGFEDRTAKAGLTGLVGGLNMIQGDYDGDGDIDVLVLRGAWLREGGEYPNSLLRNDGPAPSGTPTFTDVTFEAGLGEVHYPTQTAGWADYDNDGDLDLYIGNETDPSIQAPCQLFRNAGDGTFTDVAKKAGVRNDHFAKAVHWGDYDGDRFPDLYVSNENGPNRLYHNNGDGTFTDVADKLGVTLPMKSFPAWFWDFDNDGALDIYVSSYGWTLRPVAASYLGAKTRAEVNRLYRGDGKGGFTNVAPTVGLTRITLPMGSNFGDLDGDGWLDFYLGTGYPAYEGLMPNVFYWNRGGKRFADVTAASGLGHLQKGHAIAFCDLDGDGDQDVFAQMGGAFPGDPFGNAVFRNPGFGNQRLEVRLVGVESNRFGVGARIRCEITEDGETRSIYRHVGSGGTFGGSPLTQTIGVGKATKIDVLEVFWPTSDTTQTFRDVALDGLVVVTEGRDEI